MCGLGHGYSSYNLNSFKGVIYGLYKGVFMKGDTRSLDYRSFEDTYAGSPLCTTGPVFSSLGQQGGNTKQSDNHGSLVQALIIKRFPIKTLVHQSMFYMQKVLAPQQPQSALIESLQSIRAIRILDPNSHVFPPQPTGATYPVQFSRNPYKPFGSCV